jgi:hypothetical protein
MKRTRTVVALALVALALVPVGTTTARRRPRERIYVYRGTATQDPATTVEFFLTINHRVKQVGEYRNFISSFWIRHTQLDPVGGNNACVPDDSRPLLHYDTVAITDSAIPVDKGPDKEITVSDGEDHTFPDKGGRLVWTLQASGRAGGTIAGSLTLTDLSDGGSGCATGELPFTAVAV